MKKTIIPSLLIAATLLPGCSSFSNLANGTLIGGGAGAAVGAGLGAAIGDGKGAAIGALVGTAVGAGAGAIIGNKMDKKAEELKALENAQVETITDVNGLAAVKVTFASGILFPTNGTTLNASSKRELAEFANKMKDMQDTDITIYGHTDNTGTAEVNERISAQRANAVSSYLQSCGMAAKRMKAAGKSYNEPVADNGTVEGRARNRRVEIYVTANEAMIRQAQEAAK